jgi:hypothetical protein
MKPHLEACRILLSRVLAVALLFGLAGFTRTSLRAADVISTWNGSTGNWTDATRWSSNPQFPNNGNGGFTYDAIINSGTLTLDQNITIEALNLTGGTLTCAAATNFTLTLNDLFTRTSGTIGGPGTVLATDGITISSGNSKTLGNGGNTGRTLTNSGVANFSGGSLLISSSGGANPGSLLQNNGTFNATDGASISNNNFGGSAGRFTNAGTFNKSGTGTTTSISAQFNNSGTVNVDQGTLELSGSSTHTGGTIAIDAGALFRFSSGTHTVDSASTITGAGDFTFGGGTITVDGAYTVTGITSVTGGTINFNTPAATLTTLNMSAGQLGGTGSQNITTAFNWNSSTLAGTGTTTINNTATLTMSTSNSKTLGNGGNTGRTLINNGIANLSGAAFLISSSGGANPGSLFQNNATFNVTDEADISNNNFGGSAGRFNNAGTFNKSGAGTTTAISALFNNIGTVNLDQGILELSGGGTSTGGTMAVDAGATMRFSSGTFTLDGASTTTGAGDVSFTGGTTNIDGAYTVTGITTIGAGGTANFNTPAATLSTLNLAGTLGGGGSQNITSAFNWTAGTLASTGTTTVDNTATLTMSTTNSKTLGNGGNTGRTLVSNGVANLSGGTLLISSSGGANPGSLFQNNGTFNATDEADISNNNFGGPAGRFTNAGTFNKSGAGTTTTVSALFNNTGTVNVDQGVLELSGGGTSTGGTIAVDPGANLRFASGTHTFDNASAITGGGDVTFANATVTLEGPYTIGGVTTISGGTVNFNTPTATLTTLNLSGGTLAGTGTQNVTTALNWTGGSFAGTGTTTVDNNATLSMTGTNSKTLGNGGNTGRTLVNNGVGNLSGGNLLISSSGGASPGSLFQNNGTFNVTDDADISNNNFGGPAGRFTNAGTFNKSGVGITTDVSALFNNTGTINVNEGTLAINGPFTNYDAATDTLTGGTYNVTSTFRFLNADVSTNRASITLNGPTSQIVDQGGANALTDFSVNDTSAFFGITNNRNFTTTAAFTNRGDVQIGGGTFDAASITNDSAGEFFGFGTIADAITNSGVVRSAGGTLNMGGAITGPAGTIQIDSGSSLNLSGAGGDSNADFLVHNGSGLNLGANDISVREDYNNANFGVGNAFNHRANVTGAGEILADSVFTLSASGDVTGGSTINIGNHRVGSTVNRAYQVNHNGTAGSSPQVRTAIQTSANGGNITDPRLSGAGVTASNLAPIASGANSGPLAVTFTPSSAGALVGQAVHIEDNFDNVSGLTLAITGAAYHPAAANVAPANVNFGNFHVGDVVTPQAITISNTAPAGAFSEDLRANNFIAAPDAVIAGGSPTSVQLIAGASNNALAVSITTGTAGVRTGALTMDLTSTGEVAGTSIPGLAPLSLGQRTINLSANVFRLASASPHTPEPVNLGNFHVGDAPPQQALSITNNAPADGFSENLDATIGGATGGVTASGSFTAVAPGATNNSSLIVGIDTATAGNKSGTATINLTSNGAGTSGLGLTVLPSQTVNVTGSVFRLASASPHTPEPVDFGIIHVGDTVQQALTIANTAANDGFSEGLNATIGNPIGNATTNSGSFTALAAGGLNNTSLSVGIDTTTAGAKTGTATIALASNGAGTSGLGITPLASQTVNVQAQVNNFAVADIVKLAGDGTLTATGANAFLLDLGTVVMGNPSLQAELGVVNDAVAPADDLAGSFALAAPDFLLTGFDPFSDDDHEAITAGSTRGGLMVELDTATIGLFSGQITLNSRSINARPFSLDLPPVTIQLRGEVVPIPEPASLSVALLAAGLIGIRVRKLRGRIGAQK